VRELAGRRTGVAHPARQSTRGLEAGDVSLYPPTGVNRKQLRGFAESKFITKAENIARLLDRHAWTLSRGLDQLNYQSHRSPGIESNRKVLSRSLPPRIQPPRSTRRIACSLGIHNLWQTREAYCAPLVMTSVWIEEAADLSGGLVS